MSCAVLFLASTIVIAASVCTNAARASAQPLDQTRPAAARRIVATFGFNRVPLNASGTPEGWVRAQHDPDVPRDRPGFPIWNEARVDLRGPKVAGEGSLALPTRGGSTSLRLKPGVVATLPGAAYAVAAHIRTQDLREARAFLAACYLDANGDPIPGTHRRSEAVRSPEAWRRVVVRLPSQEDAAFIQLEALVLQPRQQGAVTKHEDVAVYEADYEGTAWFDDIAVVQMPRFELSTDAPGNVVASATSPEISVRLRDLAGEPLTAEIIVRDASNAIVWRHDLDAPRGHLSERVTPALPGFGWYRAEARVHAPLGDIAAGVLGFAWVPPQRSDQSDNRHRADARAGGTAAVNRAALAIGAEELASQHLPALPGLGRAIGVGRVEIPLLDPAQTDPLDLESLRARNNLVLDVVRELAASGISAAATFARVPTPVASAHGIDPHDVAAFLAGGPEDWAPLLGDALDRIGQSVTRWHVGPIVPDPTIAPTSRRTIPTAAESISRLVALPTVGFGVAAHQPLTQQLAARGISPAIELPPGATDAGIADHIDTWNSLADTDDEPHGAEGSTPLRFVIRAHDPNERGITQHARAATAIVRAIEALAAAADRGVPSPTLLLDTPWTTAPVPHDADATVLMPTAHAPAWRTLGDVLERRRPAETIELARGVHALLLEPTDPEPRQRTPAMAVWQQSPRQTNDPVEMLVASGPVTRLDIFGNRTTLDPVSVTDTGIRAHRIAVGDDPIFIEGVDLELLRFQTAIALDPPVLQSRHARHLHEVVMQNPWPVAVRGHQYIVEPGGLSEGAARSQSSWRITPRQGRVSIETGGTQRIPIDLRFSPAEEAGIKPFVVDIELEADKPYGIIRVRREIELGLSGITMELTYRRSEGNDGNQNGSDIFIEARITNENDEPLTADLRAHAAGYARDESVVADVGKGETALRVFPFAGGATRLAGQRVAVGLFLPDRGGRLTKTVQIPAFND